MKSNAKNNMIFHTISYSLILVGALNWGLVGIFDFNLVSAVLGSLPVAENLVYILVAGAAVYSILTHKKECCTCGMCDCGSEDGCGCGGDCACGSKEK